MLTWVIIGVVLFLISSGGSTFGIIGRRRTGRSKVGNSNQARKIRNRYDKFAKEFAAREDKDVPLKGFDIREKFNSFPFMSNFSNVSNYLQDRNLETIVDVSAQHFNKLFEDYLNAILANAATGSFGFSESEVYDVMVYFTEQTYLEFLALFVGEVLPHLMKAKNSKNWSDDFIERHLREYNESIGRNYRSIFDGRAQNNDAGADFFSNYQQFDQNYQNSFDAEADELKKAYKSLGVSETSSEDVIKKNYRKLAKEYHPDKNNSENAKEKMSEINSAYALIRKKRGF